MINIVPFLLLLSCVCSTNQSNIKYNLKNKTPKNSIQTLKAVRQVSKEVQSERKTISIIVSYSAISCGCPQWFETRFKEVKFLNKVNRFYLEPTNKALVNADDLWDGQTLPLTLKLVGRFSKDKEMPKTYNTKTTPEKAMIFWYDKIVIISGVKQAR